MNKTVLGIDIGAGSIKAGVFGEDGIILEEKREQTNGGMNNSDFAAAVLRSIRPLLDTYPVQGIGVGSPGPIDTDKGIIYSSANLPNLDSFPIVETIHSSSNLPIFFNNDANCAALGEYYFGKGKMSPNLFVFTLGTGLGGGWVSNGVLYNGFNGNGMEVGHITIVKDGAVCGCGQKGCAESYFSAKGLLGRYKDKTNIQLETVAELFQMVESGDTIANQVLQYGVEVLAEATRSVIHLLNLDTIVYVGGLTQSWSLYGEQLEQLIRSKLFPILSKRCQIYTGENQAILGAGSLAFPK